MRETDTGRMDPTSVLDWAFDWAPWLDADDTILSAEFDPEDVTIDHHVVADKRVTVWLRDPTPGVRTARVRCWITTTQGRHEPRTLRLAIEHR